MYVTMISMPRPLSPEHIPTEVTIKFPLGIELPDFDDPTIWDYFTPFHVPKIGEDVTFHAAWLLPGRDRKALSEHALPHVHMQSQDESKPDDWRIILNLDPTKPLPFRWLNALVDEENGFTFSEAPGGHYVEESPGAVVEQKRLKTFRDNTAEGIAFRAGEVAHNGCAAEILGNRAVIFAQEPFLPPHEDHYAEGEEFIKNGAEFATNSHTALPDQG